MRWGRRGNIAVALSTGYRYSVRVDPLLRSDALLNRETPPQEKLRQALELMQTGLLWKRAALERGSPGANVEEIDEMLRAWLLADD